MAWKYKRNNLDFPGAVSRRELQTYIPFALRDESLQSPFYNFKHGEKPAVQTDSPIIAPMPSSSTSKTSRRTSQEPPRHWYSQSSEGIHHSKSEMFSINEIGSNQLNKRHEAESVQLESSPSGNQLNRYFEYAILERGQQINKKAGLREIFVCFKKFKSSFLQILVEKFFVPNYTHASDHTELAHDFHYWKDYLAKWLRVGDKVVDNVFTSSGLRITNLSMIPQGENILIIQDSSSDELTFWQEFQICHNLKLTLAQSKHFVSHVNGLQRKEDILKSFLSYQTICQIIGKIGFRGDRSHLSISISEKNFGGRTTLREKQLILPNIYPSSQYSPTLEQAPASQAPLNILNNATSNPLLPNFKSREQLDPKKTSYIKSSTHSNASLDKSEQTDFPTNPLKPAKKRVQINLMSKQG